MVTKRIVGLLLLLGLVLLPVTANESDGQGGPKTLTISVYDRAEIIDPAVAAYEAQYPDVSVEVQYVSNEQYDNVINTRLASGAGPDILELGAQIRNLISAGRVLDLTEYDFMDRFHDSFLIAASEGDSVFGAPWMSWMEGIFYNKDMFAAAGITDIPRHWDEFIEVHRVLRDAGFEPQIMGAQSWEPMMKQSMALAISDFYQDRPNFDYQFSDGEKDLSGNWDKYLIAWSEIVTEGFITSEMLGISYDQAQDYFATGQAAMWESGNWAVPFIIEKNPDLNYGFFPIPGYGNSEPHLVGGPGNWWAVNSASENIDEALDFLRVWTEPEVQLGVQANYGGGLPVKGVEAPLPPGMEGAQEALANGRNHVPWNQWFGAQSIIIEYAKGLQEYLATDGEDEDLLLEVLRKADAQRDIMNETR